MNPLEQSSRSASIKAFAFIPVIVALLVMGRLCFGEFIWWDDNYTVHHNPLLNPPHLATIQFYWLHPAYRIYSPLTYMVWTVLAVLGRDTPDANGIALNSVVFHTANVILHLLAVLVVGRILQLLNMRTWGVVCGALIFAIHPLQVEPVGWVSGLKDVLSGVLALGALHQYIRFAIDEKNGRPRQSRLYLSVSILILAMLAKSTAATMVLAAAGIDRWIVGRPWRTIFSSLDIPAIATLPFLWIAHAAQGSGDITPVPLWERPLVACDAITFYIHKLLWPTGLCIDYGRTPETIIHQPWIWLSCAIAIGLIAAAIVLRRRAPALLGSGAVFIAGVLPTLGFTTFATQFYSTTADHYLYWAMLGPAIAVAWTLTKFSESIALRAIAVVGVAALSFISIRQGRFWKDNVSLLEHTLAVNPKSFAAFNNLGSEYDREQKLPQAADAFRHAIQIRPDLSLAHSNLGSALRDLGNLSGSIAELRISINLQRQRDLRLRQTWLKDLNLLGQDLLDEGAPAEAVEPLRESLDANGDQDIASSLLAEARERMRSDR